MLVSFFLSLCTLLSYKHGNVDVEAVFLKETQNGKLALTCVFSSVDVLYRNFKRTILSRKKRKISNERLQGVRLIDKASGDKLQTYLCF